MRDNSGTRSLLFWPRIRSKNTLGFQAPSQNCEKLLLASSCMYVRLSAWNNSVPTGRNLIKCDIRLFFGKKNSRNSSFVKIEKEHWALYTNSVYIDDNISFIVFRMRNVPEKTCRRNQSILYRVIQDESAILWEMIVCVILSKNVHMNMGPILNGYRDMVKRRYGPSCEHEQQLRNK